MEAPCTFSAAREPLHQPLSLSLFRCAAFWQALHWHDSPSAPAAPGLCGAGHQPRGHARSVPTCCTSSWVRSVSPM